MEYMSDPRGIFSELLTSVFTKLNPLLNTRKHKEIFDLCTRAAEAAAKDTSLDANKYFPVLKHALSTKHSRVLETSLYYIQKLISHGFMDGRCPDLNNGRPLIENILESVCECAYEQDDPVQLQVIKLILTIATSCEVHGKPLLEAFNACYYIHSYSQNMIIANTAKACLTHIVNHVFKHIQQKRKQDQGRIIQKLMIGLIDDIELYNKRLEMNIESEIRTVPQELEIGEASWPSVSVINEIGQESGKFGWCVECRKTADFYCRDTRDPVCSENCKDSHIQSLSEENRGYFVDALMIFQAICELNTEEIDNNEQILTLELILIMTNYPNQGQAFLEIIRGHLLGKLLKNSLSTEANVLNLSLSIFVALVNNFKDSLKSEIGVFMNDVFLKLLESEHSSMAQRLQVIETFYKIIQNPKVTLELFLNYDCDVDDNDIFAKLIDVLRKISVDNNSELALKNSALKTLVSFLQAQTIWLEEDTSEKTPTLPKDEDFEKNKQLKTTLNIAVNKFNIKPSIGLQYLSDNEKLDLSSCSEIASFLKQTAGISKTLVGEYLGASKNSEVLHEYLQLFCFSGKTLLESLREFLLSFRIPGEGQVVDRIMEKFAEKYCVDNPGSFASADSAFLLSFAIMMLQTDLHNPSVKKKMPEEQFCMMVSHDSSIPKQLLQEIYSEVKENPFTLKEDEEAKMQLNKKTFAMESQMILEKGQAAFSQKKENSVFHLAEETTHLKTMFESLWHPLLATFSIVLEESEDLAQWELSLKGLIACITVACRFSMSLELEVFLSSLAKFTSMIYLNNQVTQKNIECLKALIEIAKIQSTYLKGSWMHILRCLSKLDYYHIIHANLHPGPISQVDLLNSQAVLANVTTEDVDYIFSLSKQFDNASIIDFVNCLVEISKDELDREYPQTFSLQALVNVADINMDRMRFVWGQLWHRLKAHFSYAGVVPQQEIACFAVDSLKQLAVKFLQKEELTTFHFQQEFMSPFEIIFKTSKNANVRELVVDCISHLVYTISDSIKSGWHSVLEVFSIACKSDEYAESVLKAMEFIDFNHLPHFREFISTLKELAATSVEAVSKRSLDLLLTCSEKGTEYLILIYSALASRVLDRRTCIQDLASGMIFELLDKFGDVHSIEEWKLVYSVVLLPVCDDVVSGEEIDLQWLRNTWVKFITKFIDVIDKRFEDLSSLLSDFLKLLEKIVIQRPEEGSEILRHFGVVLGNQMRNEEWESLVNILKYLLSIRFEIFALKTCHEIVKTGYVPKHLMHKLLENCKTGYEESKKSDVKVEVEALKCLLEILFQLQDKDLNDLLYSMCRDLFVNPRDEMIEVICQTVMPSIRRNLTCAIEYIGRDLAGLCIADNIQVREHLKPVLSDMIKLV